MQEESETFKIFSEMYYKRINALDELCLKEIKLEKLGVSKIDKVKESKNLGQPPWWNEPF